MTEQNNEAFAEIAFGVADGIADIVLNRPDAANAFTPRMCHELYRAAIACDERDDVRAVLISAAGRMFSAGGDLRFFAEQGDGLGAALKEMTGHLHAAIARFSHMDAPVVCAVNGMAAGAGFSLAAACDVTVAADSARFTLAYTAAGLSPDGSATWFLPRLVGLRRARELMLTNRMLSADEAMAFGLVDRVVPEDTLAEAAAALADGFAKGPTRAFGATKRLLQESWANGLETQMDRETRSIAGLARTADAKEGIDAFLGKRKPDFQGK